MQPPQTEIILKHGDLELAQRLVPPGEYVIGRSHEAEIHADTPLLSRRHARLTLQDDQLFIEDLASSNGTFINQQPVDQITRFFPDQELRLGPDGTPGGRSLPRKEPSISFRSSLGTRRKQHECDSPTDEEKAK